MDITRPRRWWSMLRRRRSGTRWRLPIRVQVTHGSPAIGRRPDRGGSGGRDIGHAARIRAHTGSLRATTAPGGIPGIGDRDLISRVRGYLAGTAAARAFLDNQ